MIVDLGSLLVRAHGHMVRLIVLTASLCFVFPASPVQAQSVDTMPVEEVFTQAKRFLNAREFGRARSFMSELITRLSAYEEDNNTARQMLEWANFHMGLAALESGNIDAGIQDLERYRAKYKREGLWYVQATILQANGYAIKEKWQQCINTATPMSKDNSVNPNDRLVCFQLIAESYYRLEKWEDAINPNIYVFKNSQNTEVRNDAAVKLLNCYVRLDRMQKLFEFLPVVARTDARYDIEFNLSLIEAGDRNFDEDRFNNAIMLYRLVYTKPQLLEKVETRLAKLRQTIKFMKDSGLNQDKSVRLQQALRNQKDAEEQLKRLQEYPEYNQEVYIRSARTYLELKMFWEALVLFRHVFEEYPDHELAEQSLYSAFSTALEMEREERAIAEGYDYVEAFPAGAFWDTVTVVVMQMHVQREEYQKCLDLGRTALEKKRNHEKADQVEYLIGFSLFQLDRVEDALAQFGQVISRYPDSFFREPSEYWHALAQLFLAHYGEAQQEFEAFVTKYNDKSPFHEDASFRLGVSYYGVNNFEKSAEIIEAFVKKYPDTDLTGEALYMLADIYASWSDLDKAIEYYTKVPDVALNMVQINYATFQVAKVMELEQRWDEIIALFETYKAEYKHHANFTEATYWIGNANIHKGDIPKAMEVFFDAIIKWGDKPEHYGIDMILRDLVAQAAQLRGTPAFDNVMQRLFKELDKAREADRKTLELRLLALFAGTETDQALKNRLVASLVRERNIPISGPITLQLMGQFAADEGQSELASKIFEYFYNEHPNSDLNMAAMRGVALSRMDQKKWDEALVVLNEMITKYPMFEDAGWAKKTIGDVFRLQNKWKDAVAEYETVLAVKEWKGEGALWAEALYWIGECHVQMGQSADAHNYFQRVYVLYATHLEWMAKSYMAAAGTLEAMGKKDEAKATLKELIDTPEVQDTPWKEQAESKLKELGA